MADYDLAIIGGGLTGASIARDAAGRGLRVILFEQSDLASGASSAASGLIAGDLELFERRALRRVRTGLAERNLLARLAPHLVRAARLILPVHPEDSPLWLRSELLLYDHLAPDAGFPQSSALDLTHHEAGVCLKRSIRIGFAYAGAVVDEARLAVLNAVDAAERGAVILTGARCVRADRDEEWRIGVVDRGHRRAISARALVNATGAWSGRTAEIVLRWRGPPARLSCESRIIVRRPSDHDGIYVLRHTDDRLIFVAPYADGFATVGMIDRAFADDPVLAAPNAGEIAYLCAAVSRYFREQLSPADVVGALCAVRPRAPRGRWHHQEEDAGTLALERGFHEAPLVTVFGGDSLMYRRRAEDVMTMLAPFFAMREPWTAFSPLAGGDFSAGYDAEVERARVRWPFLTDAHARRLISAYGTRVSQVIGEAGSLADLGSHFGPDLTAAEVRYLVGHEWARNEDDVLLRRSRLALATSPQGRDALAEFIRSAA